MSAGPAKSHETSGHGRDPSGAALFGDPWSTVNAVQQGARLQCSSNHRDWRLPDASNGTEMRAFCWPLVRSLTRPERFQQGLREGAVLPGRVRHRPLAGGGGGDNDNAIWASTSSAAS